MKLIILDRDGVINHDSDNYIKSVDEWQPIKGSVEAIATLHKLQYKIVVTTNQSGISRNYYSTNTLYAMHDKFRQLLKQVGGKVDVILHCPHGPDDNCDCRKPKTGMYKKLQTLYNTNFSKVITVGDSYRDLEAAMAVGSTPVLVRTGKGKQTLMEKKIQLEQNNIAVYDDLADFVSRFIK